LSAEIPEASDQHLRSSNLAESIPSYVRHAWSRRHFAYAMPAETFRSRHQNTVLGNVWNLLNPLLTAAVYYLIFGVILNASRGIENYILWLVVGLFAFRLTQASIMQGATSVTARQGLVRSLKFPRVLLPVATTVGELLTFAFELVILLLIAVITGEGISWKVVLLPAVIIVHTVFNFGCALIAARLNDSYRDVQQFLPFLFQILRYLSGVMVPVVLFADRGPRLIYNVLSWNPLVQILEMYRWVLLDDGSGLTTFDVAHAVVVSVVLVGVGLKFFINAEHRYGRP
jgi:teichoic acid transport system permease protein